MLVTAVVHEAVTGHRGVLWVLGGWGVVVVVGGQGRGQWGVVGWLWWLRRWLRSAGARAAGDLVYLCTGRARWGDAG